MLLSAGEVVGRGLQVSRKSATSGRVARALLLAACGLVTACSDAAPGRPDVVVIVVDCLRADLMRHIGDESPTAVSLDAFLADAAIFARAYAPSPASVPSTATLMTGLL